MTHVLGRAAEQMGRGAGAWCQTQQGQRTSEEDSVSLCLEDHLSFGSASERSDSKHKVVVCVCVGGYFCGG